MSKHGTVHWSELMTDDVEAAKTYYGNVCGWQFSEMPMPEGIYYIAMKDDVPIAGLMGTENEYFEGQTAQWITYIAVDDVDAAVKQTTEAGGKILQECMDIPGVGRIAMIKDPAGVTLGMMTPSDNS